MILIWHRPLHECPCHLYLVDIPIPHRAQGAPPPEPLLNLLDSLLRCQVVPLLKPLVLLRMIIQQRFRAALNE